MFLGAVGLCGTVKKSLWRDLEPDSVFTDILWSFSHAQLIGFSATSCVLFRLFCNKAGNGFAAASCSEDPLPVKENPEPGKEPEELIGF